MKGKWKNTAYKQKNLIGSYLYLKITERSIQLLAITSVQDNLQTQANIFFAQVTSLRPTHTHTPPSFILLEKFQFIF